MSRQPVAIANATLPFWRYRVDGRPVLEFDSTGCNCPVPMRNAMAGLERISHSGEALVMINGFEPQGLYERIEGRFDWVVERLDPQRVKVTFTATSLSARVDFNQRDCHGG